MQKPNGIPTSLLTMDKISPFLDSDLLPIIKDNTISPTELLWGSNDLKNVSYPVQKIDAW